MTINENNQNYWASSDINEFEVEFLEETKCGNFKVRCVDDDEILILASHLWTLDLINNKPKGG
jgi:hypothetical protein